MYQDPSMDMPTSVVLFITSESDHREQVTKKPLFVMSSC